MNCKTTLTLPNLSGVVIPALAGLALIGCASTRQAHHASDPDLDPSQYGKYHLVDQAVGRDTADIRITASVHRVMSSRGYTQAPSADADLYVSFKVLTVDAPRSAPQPGPMGMGAGQGDLGLDVIANQTANQREEVDKLVLVQLQDAQTLRIVWVGWAQERVDTAQLALKASDAAARILRRVPERI